MHSGGRYLCEELGGGEWSCEGRRCRELQFVRGMSEEGGILLGGNLKEKEPSRGNDERGTKKWKYV